MVVAGIIGAGLVWGWLMVLFVDHPASEQRLQKTTQAAESSSRIARWLITFIGKWQKERRPYLNLLAVIIFTSWFAWLIYILATAAMLIYFFIALVLAFLVHFAWRQQLRKARNSL